MSATAAGRIIGGRIKAARKAAGLSTTQLAEMSGVKLSSIYHIESGQRRPGRETAARIAAAVGAEIDALTSVEDPSARPLTRRKRGDLLHRGPRGSSWSVDYFWARVDKRGPDECWPWTWGGNTKGYGSVGFRGKATTVHRVAYELEIKPIPEGLEIDHMCHDPDTCRVPPDDCPHRRCCNPAHLKAVTHADNLRRRAKVVSRVRRSDRPLGRPQGLNPGVTVNQRFGLYLSAARRKAGLTQVQLGEMVGLGEASMSHIEAGKRGTSEARRAAFVAALGLDLSDLLRFINSSSTATAIQVTPSFPEPRPLFDLEAAS